MTSRPSTTRLSLAVSTPTASRTTLRRTERPNTDTVVTDEEGAACNIGLRVR